MMVFLLVEAVALIAFKWVFSQVWDSAPCYYYVVALGV